MLTLNPTRKALLIVLLVGLSIGCRATSPPPAAPCPTLTQPAKSTPPREGSTAVSSQFAQIEGYTSTELISGDSSAQTGYLTLENTICIAYENSAKANLLQSQLSKLNQTPVHELDEPECRNTFSRSINAQIVEERNRSASLAAQLFLGLIEVQLQRDLLIQAQQRLTKIKTTIEEADEEGFATANPKALLAKQSVLVAEKESELHYNDQKIRTQLTALLDLEPGTQIEVSYDLRPAPHPVDLPSKQADALSQRAELAELQYMLANWNQCSTSLASSLLALADPRLQIELAKIKEIVERSCIWNFLNPMPEEDGRDLCEESSVRQQTQTYFENSRAAVFLQIKLAAIDMQNAFEKMVISNDEIQRLEQRVEQIKAKRDIDATQAYIDLQENWYQTLLARSERVSNAIKYESAQIRLGEATGALALMCGFNGFFQPDCSSN